MKIVYVVSSLEKSGPINVLFNIVKEAVVNNNCSIITLSPENSKSMLSEFQKFDVDIIQLNMDRNDSKQSYKTNLKKIVEDINPDIIHSHGFRSDRFINSICENYPFKHVTTLHNFPFGDYPRLYGFLPGFLLSIFHLYIISSIKNKVSCSYSIAKKYNALNLDNISVIQNGVDVEHFKAINKNKKEKLRESLGLPLNAKIVISTGALIKRKRPKKLLEAIRNGSWGKEVVFIVLGEGQLYDKIKKYHSENIKILGSKNNISDYLQASDIFISNSKAEGLPMAMLEAAATGLIIVGSDIQPHNEVRSLYNEKTLLFKGQKSQTIIDKINEALTISDRFTKTSSEYSYNLSSKKMADQYLRYYQKVKVE